MTDLLGMLWGPLGGVLAAFAGVLGLWVKTRLDRRAGAAGERKRRDAQDARNYIKERSKIDDEISGIGGNDADTVERLRRIANRRGSGAD